MRLPKIQYSVALGGERADQILGAGLNSRLGCASAVCCIINGMCARCEESSKGQPSRSSADYCYTGGLCRHDESRMLVAKEKLVDRGKSSYRTCGLEQADKQ